MKNFSGRVWFLDRSDINTDEIIPAKYLTGVSKEALKEHLLEDLQLEEFNPNRDLENVQIIIARSNFGCGSSREHAPWALEANGINMVIAPSFARIFRQNMFNCGMMAVELPEETVDHLFSTFSGPDAFIETDPADSVFRIRGNGRETAIPFVISDFDRALIEAGGWLEYADAKYK
ncbi:MAG: 3-isopropylmalate dehydratase small subunit [Desulfobacterales bacterium]